MPPSAEDKLVMDGLGDKHHYYQQMLDALKEENVPLMHSAVSQLSDSEVNRSYSCKMDGVFQLPSSTVPSAVQQDVCKRNMMIIYPVHYAAMTGNQQCLQILLVAGANPNVKDSLGQTPLHILARSRSPLENREQDYQECLTLLLAQRDIKTNRVDMSGGTPLQRAKEHQWRYMVDQLKASQISSENLEQHALGISDTLLQLLIRNNITDFTNKLVSLKDLGMNAKSILHANHGSYTLLQYACRCAMPIFVDVLLTHGASVAVKFDNNLLSPILCVSKHANYKIFQRLMEAITPVDLENGVLKECTNQKETALHLLVKWKSVQETNKADYLYCLDTLMSSIIHLDINAQDEGGNTALHFAAMKNDLETIKTLMRNGAKIGIENIDGQKAISYIDKPGMLDLLDECIAYDENLSVIDNNFKITVNFSVITKSSIEKGTDTPNTEMNFLSNFTENHEDISILYHPIIEIFLHIKWQKIRKYTILNMLLHFIFQVSLMIYMILYHVMDNQIRSRTDVNNTEGVVDDPSPAAIEVEAEDIVWFLFFVFMIFLVLVMALRDLTQFLMMTSLYDYIYDMRNLIEIAIVILTIILFSPVPETAKIGVAAWLVLLSFIEFVFLTGAIPGCAIYVEMFRKVTWNFFKFLCMFSTSIIAFSFSFFLMFRTNKNFSTFSQSLMKTVIMSTGEIEYGDLPTSIFPIASEIILMLFVFIILLVLMNLLNGLAISDIQAIQKEAEIINRRNLMNYISRFEGTFEILNEHNLIKRLHNWVTGKMYVFKECLPHHHLIIYPNKKPIQYEQANHTEGLFICSCHTIKLKDKHIHSLKCVVIKKRQRI